MGKYDEQRDQIIEDIVDGLSEGIPLRELCRLPGMPNWRTVYDWIEGDEALAARIAHARTVGFEALAEEALDIADNATNDWIARRRQDGSIEEVVNGEHIQRSKLRIETRLKLLSKWAPQRYGDKQVVDVGNKDGEELKVSNNVDTAALVATIAEAIRTQKSDK